MTAAFIVAFLAGACAVFALVHAAATALGVGGLSFDARVAVAGAGLLPLAVADLRARRKGTYCPITVRRQTPRALMRGHRMDVVASLWGLDTGLVVTTFRVAAIGWGALLLTALRLSPPWIGLVYGLGFSLPFLFMLFRPQVGRASRAAAPADPGLEALLRLRGLAQDLSAALLVASGGLLLTRLAG